MITSWQGCDDDPKRVIQSYRFGPEMGLLIGVWTFRLTVYGESVFGIRCSGREGLQRVQPQRAPAMRTRDALSESSNGGNL